MDVILDDKNMISYCLDKNQKLKEFTDSFGESIHIEKTLNDASKDYLNMSHSIACLFDALKLLYMIQPAYYLNWSTVKSLLINEIDVILKEKGAIGAARAKQIETFCLETFYRHMSSILSKRHFTLFLFLHSMFLSGNMAKTNSKSKQKIDLKLTPREMFMMLYEATKKNELQKMHKHFAKSSPKPDYVCLNSWFNCIDMENKFAGVFKNLTKSLRENAKKWLEYFHLEDSINYSHHTPLTQKEIDLLNESPMGEDLGIFHKLLLWICIRPDKVTFFFSYE